MLLLQASEHAGGAYNGEVASTQSSQTAECAKV